MVQFWNSTYKCFTFGEVDLVPTVEEYTTLLRCPKVQVRRAYAKVFNGQTFTMKLMNISGMSEPWVTARIQQKGDTTNLFDCLEKGITPVPTILAETFRSLSMCRKTGEGQFIGCAQLLMVWFHGHFWKVDKVSYRVLSEGYSPLKEEAVMQRREDISEEK
ncbi:hypothetical protein PVK06_020301 [Gossypium arboreum]|uniref:DUF7745 domain-containing protein n=1 Tax=Gossypium arboreum TaxID=29729 RepID=A0ABR0PMC1_GOSAR|nr:hypothetical protein PVK06_020301 [Gossypium arboreum]